MTRRDQGGEEKGGRVFPLCCLSFFSSSLLSAGLVCREALILMKQENKNERREGGERIRKRLCVEPERVHEKNSSNLLLLLI